MSFSPARQHWDQGLRRLEDAPAEQQRMLERVVGAVHNELRRRLGGRFTVQELVDLYETGGTDWATDIAVTVAPEDPYAWDASVVADAAFALHAHAAEDWAASMQG